MDSVSFLLYVSQAPKSSSTEEDAEVLRRKIRDTRPPHEVTGILIYRRGYFMQYLEGHNTDVSELFWKLRGNVNHYNVRVLSQGVAKERRFSDWSIKHVSTNHITPSSESLIDLFETVLMSKAEVEWEIDAIIKRFCKDSVLLVIN